jgi:type I restriction enzyme S subunit
MADDDWIECSLAEACGSIDYGLTASASDGEAGPRFLRITDIVSGCVDWKAVPGVDADQATLGKYRLNDGDVVIARTGASTGASSYIKNPPPAVFASYLVRLKIKPDFDSRFIAYHLKSDAFWTFIRGVLGDKSAQPNASASTMTQAPLRAPRSKDTQRAIAHILGTLDDKIELNRQMNATLEAIARALFKSWFVNFDPVRAKAEGRDPGLPKPVADLFPDSFEDSELGEVPKEWGMRSLHQAATFVNGEAFKSEDFCDPGEGLPVVKIAELKDGISAQTKFSQRDLGPDQRIETGDLLYSWSGSPDTSLDAFLWTKGPGLVNQHIFKVITPTVTEKRFVYYLLQYLRPVLIEIARNKQTTGLGHVTVADMKRLHVCWPPEAVLAAFEGQVGPIFDKAFTNILESQTLANLRDVLLPKLLSGELRIEVAERVMGRAT